MPVALRFIRITLVITEWILIRPHNRGDEEGNDLAGSPARKLAAVFVMAGMFAAFQPSPLNAQIGALAAKAPARGASPMVRLVADMPSQSDRSSQYIRRGYGQPDVVELDKKKGKFEFFDVDNLAGMAGGAVAAGIADQRRKEYYRQDFFYGGRPYYGGPFYGGPAYYGGPYSTYYLKK